MQRRRTAGLLVSVLAVALLAACGGEGGTVALGNGPVRVATSISVFADLVRQVGGERVTVVALIPAGASAETYQPTPRDLHRLTGVRAVFINGHQLEQALLSVLRNNVPSHAPLVQLSDGLPAIKMEAKPVGRGASRPGEGGDPGGETGGNPHFWLDVQYARWYVQRIRDTLTAVDPDGGTAYAANTDSYVQELDGLDAYIRARIDTIPPDQRKLVTFHDAFPYFARAYGLQLAGYVVRAPGREPSAQEIKALGDTLRRERVRTVFTEPQFNAALLERAAADAGVQISVLYSDALTKEITSYVELMRRNADNVAEGLK